ncbi:MAG TPA: molecular chaperone DnaJ [Acidimicrobiales bacterium]|jgi:molecular chaperone DnaJ|nr:molecular chaperone DnaJ [Acidimicrobiales bacterium]
MAPQREWFEKDYYKVLGVPQSATETEIRRAYRKLAKQNHPDANPGKEERFKEISAAYDVLSEPAKRKEYDEIRRLGPMAANGAGFPGGGAGAGQPGGGFNFRTENLGDLFGDILGRFGGGAAGGPGGARTRTTASTGQRGEDLEAELHLSFTDALNGVTTTVNVTSEATCSTCHGSGAAPGTTPIVCSRCGGRGVVSDNQGLFSFSRACPQCGGRGMVVETPCPTCGGSGSEVRPRQVKVRIPAGVDDGQRIRVKGRGGPGRGGAPAGDLWVTVRVAPHGMFGRSGRNLTLTVPITFAEAALGAQVTVPTLDGSVVLRVPPGTRSGRKFRVKGRGVADEKGAGDLVVTVEVAVPTKLSAAEREAIEALAVASTASPRAHLGV